MRVMLHTPVLQRLVGRSVAEITVTGRRTRRRYTTPVSYYRTGDRLIIVSKPKRTWWRNLAAEPTMRLRLAGRTVEGRGRVLTDEDDSLAGFVELLEHRPHDAKAYGLRRSDGPVDVDAAGRLLPRVVVVEVRLDAARR